MKEKIKLFFKSKKNNELKFFLILFVIGPMLPEYIALLILLFGFTIYSIKNKKIEDIEKLELILFIYMLISTLWSTTKMFSIGMSFLYLYLYLVQYFINKINSKDSFNNIIKYIVLGSSIIGLIGFIQFISIILLPYLNYELLPTILYKNVDNFIYNILPFDVDIKYFKTRASSTFCNPNIFASILCFTFPFSIYQISTQISKKNIIQTLLIFLGIVSTKTRIALFLSIFSLIFLLPLFEKKYRKIIILIIITCFIVSMATIMSRFNNINISNIYLIFQGKSNNTHIQIWKSCIDYLNSNIRIIYGNGLGVQSTWNILLNQYNLNYPHAHNIFIEMLMQLGIIGLAIFICIIYLILAKTKKIINTNKNIGLTILNIIVCFIIFGMTDYLFNSPKQIMMFFTIIGLTSTAYKIYCNKK